MSDADAQAFRVLHPAEFYKRFLTQNIRPDGRALLRARKLTLSVGTITSADGSASVQIGNTSVVVGVKGEVGSTLEASPNAGRIELNAELTPLCAPRFRPGKPSEEAHCLTEALVRVLTSARVVNLDELCLSERKSAWILYVDVFCLNHDGNVFDAALIGVLAALSNATLPQVQITDAGEVVMKDGPRTPLQLLHYPLSFTCGILETHLLADPNAEEEALLSCKITVVYDEMGRLCMVDKPGGSPLPPDKHKLCLEYAKKSYPKLLSQLRKLIKA
mmetsp:Transcript_21566/g.35707  ORF Transcript_21566/g.35707 Transcript_21566/m.35707 type:complete len:275 (+) Transcript_21566:96-920(+)